VPFIPRDAVVDTTLLGHFVPRGTLVLFINQGPGIVAPAAWEAVPEAVRSASSRTHGPARGAWDDADVGMFKPERWLVSPPPASSTTSSGQVSAPVDSGKPAGEKKKKEKQEAKAGAAAETTFNPSAGPHAAFGAGPRGCFGRRLAYLELRLLFTMLVWHFDFLPLPEALRSYESLDGMTTMPKMAYVKLQRAGW
jgi:hypothetical protein